MSLSDNFLKLLKKFLSQEWFLFLLFTLTHLVNKGDMNYLLITGLYFFALYLSNKDLIKTTWLTFLSLLLFFRARYISLPVYLPSHFQSIYGDINLNEVFFVTFADGFVFVLLYLIKRSDKLKYSKALHLELSDWAILLFLFLSLISSFISFFPNTSWFYLGRLVLMILTYYIARILCSERDIVKSSLRILVVFAVFQATLVILQGLNRGPLGLAIEDFYTSYGRYADELPSLYRPGGIFWDANLSASILLVLLPMIFYLMFENRRQTKIWWMFFVEAFLVFLAIILSGSRAVWLILVFMIYLFIKRFPDWKDFFQKTRTNKKIIYALLIVGLSFVPRLVTRLLTLTQVFSSQGGFIYRWSQIKLSFQSALRNWFGLGLNVFQYEKVLSESVTQERRLAGFAPVHNLLAQAISATGFLGGLVMLLLLFSIVKKIAKQVVIKNNLLNLFLSFSILAYLLTAQFYPWLYSIQITQLFFIILGIYYANSKKISE